MGQRGGASRCPAACTMHRMLGAIFFHLQQVRCGQQGQEVSKVLVPHHHPMSDEDETNDPRENFF